MKILSWNCNMKFREKFQMLRSLNADILVIQECENPAIVQDDSYHKFVQNYIWTGKNPHKGLGIFAKESVKLIDNCWETYGLRHFLSVKVNDKFNLLGVWACKPYIEEYCVYQNIHLPLYDSEMVIIGDFNSNANWDKKHGSRSHTVVVDGLKQVGLVSAYHKIYGELQGGETRKTFFSYRHPDKGYHIDYGFAAEQRIKDYQVFDTSWLRYSDHIPVLLEI